DDADNARSGRESAKPRAALGVGRFGLGQSAGDRTGGAAAVTGFGDLRQDAGRRLFRLAHHAVELVVDLRLDGAELVLDLAALLEQAGELRVEALEHDHLAVSLLEQTDRGGIALAGCGITLHTKLLTVETVYWR